MIAKAETSPSPGLQREAAAAKRFLERMDVSGDLYALRQRMVRWILRLLR
jgi:hypothetical protein